jgi:flavodoxin
MRTLVVFYSRTGNTRRIGKEIAEKLKADFEEIIEITKREGFFAYLKSGFDAKREKDTRIRPLSKDISRYKCIILGTPLWVGNITPALRTFLKTHDLKNKKVHIFFTSGNGEAGEAESAVKSLLHTKISGKILSLGAEEIKNGAYSKKLKLFIRGVK